MSKLRALAIGILSAVAAVAVTGCGEKKVIIPEGAENTITTFIAKKTPETAHDVACPSDVEAKVGNTFDCTFDDSQGKNYVAHMRITKIDGTRVLFAINSELAH